MEHNAVEDSGEVGVEVIGDGATNLFGLVELVSDFLQRFGRDAHF